MYVTINTECGIASDDLTGLEIVSPTYCFTVHETTANGLTYPVFSEFACDLQELQSFIKLYHAMRVATGRKQ